MKGLEWVTQYDDAGVGLRLLGLRFGSTPAHTHLTEHPRAVKAHQYPVCAGQH